MTAIQRALGRTVRMLGLLLLCTGLTVSSPLWAVAANPATPPLRIAILGNPNNEVKWSDEGMKKLKAIGFTAVQLNVAWGSRPFGEVLNLSDVVTLSGDTELPRSREWKEELKRRAQLAKRHGLRTLFHFGSPRMDRNPNTGEVARHPYRIDDVTFDSWYDILNPKVRDHELALLRTFRREFPDVEDIIVYTYDQDGWQTPEYQISRFSYGVPLSDRLPAYLAALHQAWTEGRSGKAKLWWEPWELSAGQVYASLPRLPRTDFGIMLHSNIGEVILTMPADVWFRNTVRMSRDLGIPVVAEGVFSSMPQETEPVSIPAPRLVDEQYLALAREQGVVGIKEYFGTDVSKPDLNLDMLQARIGSPSGSTDELIDEITRRFGSAQGEVRELVGLLADALQVFPWDASLQAFSMGRRSIDHGWTGATIRGVLPENTSFQGTPSWRSTRKATFMVVEGSESNFWLLEDIGLRSRLAADTLAKADAVAARAIARLSDAADRAQFERIRSDAETIRRIALSYALHLRETNVAQLLRQDLEAGRPLTPALLKELGKLLDDDVENQKGRGRVVEMRHLFHTNPALFVQRYLLPMAPDPSKAEPSTLTTRCGTEPCRATQDK